ncbi:VOC family protein [Streptomyces sp. NPDC091215]|uniref:VOC family protein n=1 Tax=Streptomyces sp. NPDC091215 TaxID=3155192 RepID=UPI003438F7C2
MATSWSLTIDCTHPAKLASFWALALGYAKKPAPAGFGSWEEWCQRLRMRVVAEVSRDPEQHTDHCLE